MAHWTAEQSEYLKANYSRMSADRLAAALNRSISSVMQKRRNMGLQSNRMWTQEDQEYLAENWGTVSVPGMCKALGRSKNAIICRVHRLGLPPYLEAGEYITLNQLVIAVTGSKSNYSYKMTSWVENRGLPVHNKRRDMETCRVVYLKEFWDWADKNRSFINFAKMEPLALGEEPDWVAGQRKRDYIADANYRKDAWTRIEDERLRSYLRQYRYGYAELARMLGRSAGGIQRRILDLGLKERPIKADNRQEYTQSNLNMMADMIREGHSYSAIGEILGKSEKAIRGKVFTVYLTENADKIREMLGSGAWGTGAPVPTVRQALNLSCCRAKTISNLSALAGILVYRRNVLGWEPYWQRNMCIKWHDVKGCTAGCENCDECTEFQRIRPQYCSRCGTTFFEREESRICERCRIARKKQAQRKWRYLQGAGARAGSTVPEEL